MQQIAIWRGCQAQNGLEGAPVLEAGMCTEHTPTGQTTMQPSPSAAVAPVTDNTGIRAGTLGNFHSATVRCCKPAASAQQAFPCLCNRLPFLAILIKPHPGFQLIVVARAMLPFAIGEIGLGDNRGETRIDDAQRRGAGE